MNASKVSVLLALACLILAPACSERPLASRDGSVHFTVSESYRSPSQPGVPTILLSLVTDKIYECCNYAIETQVLRVGPRLSVGILGIRRPEVCLTALGPAAYGGFLDLGEGVYTLEFHDRSQRSVFELTVDEDSLVINGAAGVGTGLAYPNYTVFWRYPRNSFAVLCGTTEETAWIYEDFLSRLRAAVELEEIEFPAYGELGYPRAPDGYHVNHPAEFFVYASDDDFQAAGDVLRAYVRDVIGQPLGVSIYLRSWKNEWFRSWMMD